jgi:hypothetical protein
MSRIRLPFAYSIAIFSLYLSSLAQVHADELQHKGTLLRFGGLLGGGFVDWAGKDADDGLPGRAAVATFGVSAGLIATLDLTRLLGLGIEPFYVAVQPELVYSTKGTQFEVDGEERSSVDLRYLLAGLVFRAEYATAGRATPYVLLGPELGFLLRAETTNRFGMTSDIKNNFKSTDLGLILGLGTMYSLPPWGSVGLELRGDLGLVSIDGQGDGDEIRNAALTLLLVYLY